MVSLESFKIIITLCTWNSAWWATSFDQAPASARKGLASLIILTAWWIWKHRNGCIFDGDRPSVSHLTTTIKD